MKTAIAVFLGIAFPALLCAEDMALRWKEIPRSLVDGRQVQVRLADNSVLHGKAVAVTPLGLQMEIAKVRGGTGQYRQGESIVPAGEISMVKVNRTGTRGRIIGTAIGGGISALALIGVYGVSQNEGYDAAASGAAAGLALAPAGVGYLVGWARDRHFTTIHVVQP